ncbi:MAG: glycosyltransferase family 4 protein [Cytophagales bacterium]
MKVLFICNEYPPSAHGGIGVVVKNIAEFLSSNGHEALVLGYDNSIKNNLKETINGVVVIRLKNNFDNSKKIKIGRYFLSLSPIRKRYYLSSKLRQIEKDFKPDLIESYDWSGPLLLKPKSTLIVRMHGAHSAHQYYLNKPFSKLMYFFEKRNVKMADQLCAVSKHIGKLTLKALDLSKKFTVIYNSVDTEKFISKNNLKPETIRFLYLGRIHKKKGLEELFEVYNFLLADFPESKLILLGQSNDEIEKQLLSMVDPKFHQNIMFKKAIEYNEVPSEINKATCLLMPSRAEAFGLSAIEGMACEKPVFLTSGSSGPEIVEDGKDGFLLNFQDYSKSATRIKNVLMDRDLSEKVAQNARKSAIRKFSENTIMNENLRYYRKIINEV